MSGIQVHHAKLWFAGDARNWKLAEFKSAFILLTNTCNNCHRATKHEFNVIRVPQTPPFTNQVFEKQP
jgi:hypothetical protein